MYRPRRKKKPRPKAAARKQIKERKMRETASKRPSAPRKETKPEWVKTGIPGFDELFESGIPRGTNVLIAGGPGTGKTIFCLQALYNAARDGNHCLFVSFEESPERLEKHMLEFGWDIDKLPKGSFTIKRMDAFKIARTVEALLEYAAGRLRMKLDLLELTELSELSAVGNKNPIIAFDSVSALESAFSGMGESYRVYIEQLFRLFERMGATTFLITETGEAPSRYSRTGVEEFLADGVFVLYNFKIQDARMRAIEILKLRGTRHETKIVPMRITKEGLVVHPGERVYGIEEMK